MKLKLIELNPNPFKADINDGKLNEEQIEKITANLDELGLMGSIPVVKIGGKYCLVHSHHRVEALKRKFGKDYQVEVTIHNYNEEQLLKGMVIENLTQRKNHIREEIENFVAVKKFLEKHVRISDKPRNQFERDGTIGARQIAEFLNGKKEDGVISKTAVCDAMRIFENIPEEILNKVTDKQGQNEEGYLRKDQIVYLSKIEDPKEVKAVAEALLRSENQRVIDHREFINEYVKADDELKEKVRSGELDISRLSEEKIKRQIKERMDGIKSEEDTEIRAVHAKEVVSELREHILETRREFEKFMAQIKIVHRSGVKWFDHRSRSDFLQLIGRTKKQMTEWQEVLDKIESDVEGVENEEN